MSKLEKTLLINNTFTLLIYCTYLIECAEKLKSSLFIVGEMGENDYKYALFQGKTIEDVKTLVLEVVQAIKDVVTVSLNTCL